jgi:hypothetical protein
VLIRVLPKPRLVIKSVFSGVSDFPFFEPATIDLLDRNVNTDVLNVNAHPTSPATVELLSVVSNGHIEITKATNLSNIVFHLMNFYSFMGPKIRHMVDTLPQKDPRDSVIGNRVMLFADGWKITIDSTPFTDSNVELLGKLGGYAITHVGKVEREDASSFLLDDGKELITHLMYFLSFARGSWVSPILSIGNDANGTEVWEEWGIRKTGPWSKARSCFDKLHVEMLPPLYTGFCSQVSDPTWATQLPRAVYWYVESNAHPGGTDGALILSQVALESLSWNFLVNDKKNLTPKRFDHLSAAERFRLLISQCGIPLEVPGSLVNLSSIAKANTRLDGANAIARIRNNLVHPLLVNPLKEGVPPDTTQICETLTLALWYIELVILRLCGFSGSYSSRVSDSHWDGDAEPVPWATVPHQ